MFILILSVSLIVFAVYFGLWIFDMKEVYSKGNQSIDHLTTSPIFRDFVKTILICGIALIIVNSQLTSSIFEGLNSVLWAISAILSLLISYIWFHHINQLDVFEPESYPPLILTFLGGVACTFLVDPLTDMYYFLIPMKHTGTIIQDFFVAVTQIGMIEEFVKLIPLLVLWRFTKVLNESFDFILYGIVSALGFAFVENTLYLYNSELTAIDGRALFSSPMHLFLTGLIGYRLALAKLLRKNILKVLLVSYFVSSLLHGVYDFWLINFEELAFLSVFMLLLVLKAIVRMLNNGLNVSEFYRHIIIDAKQFKYSLSVYFALLMAITYIGKSLITNSSDANQLLLGSLFYYTFLTAFVGLNFSNIRVIPGYISKLLDQDVNLFRHLLPLGINTENCSNQTVVLAIDDNMRLTKNGAFLKPHLPCTIRLIHPAVVNDNHSFYLADLTVPLPFKHYLSSHLLITALDTDYSLCSGKKIMAKVYVIKRMRQLRPGVFHKKDVTFICNVRAKKVQ